MKIKQTKRPGLTADEHIDAQRFLTETSNKLCSEATRIMNLYPLSNPPGPIRRALRAVDRARDGIADARIALETQFYHENPDYRGALPDLAALRDHEKGVSK